MVYRNIKTGAEIITNSVIIAPNWIKVTDKVTPKEAPIVEPPKEEPIKEEAPKEEPVKEEAPKVTKSAPKKATSKKKGTRK